MEKTSAVSPNSRNRRSISTLSTTIQYTGRVVAREIGQEEEIHGIQMGQ